jgi:5-methylcytosine-specific restriction endonuclease McrA
MFQTRNERQDFYKLPIWKKTSKTKLYYSPYCENPGCDEYATEVHHIVDIAIAPHKALDMSNLQSLCKKCHSTITANRSTEAHKESDLNHVWRPNVYKY